VLRLDAFRSLWAVLALSSFGDWLGLLATTAFAFFFVGVTDGSYTQASLAVSLVFVLRLAPAILLGPIAGVVADRVDRRTLLVVGDVLRFGLFASIPIVGSLTWLYIATVLIEIVALFWMPAKDSLVPDLVPRRRLEAANQLSVVATYGTAPVAALFLAMIALLVGVSGRLVPGFDGPSAVDIALYLNALTFLIAAVVVARLPLPAAAVRARGPSGGVWADVLEGWRYIVRHRFVRGLVGGMLGAFAAGGFVIGLGLPYVFSLGAGIAGYGVLFGAVFVGMALGVWQAPRWLAGFSRRRLFGLAIVVAGAFLVLLGLSPNIVLSTIAVLGLGAGAGAAWVTGQTLLGSEVDESMRGRTFAFVQTMVRIVLVAVMAAAPALAALIGFRTLRVTDRLAYAYSGAGLVFVLAGVLALTVGVLAFRAMDDRRGAPVGADLMRALRGGRAADGLGDVVSTPVAVPADRGEDGAGRFIVVEGGDGSGKTTQVQLLVDWLITELGHDTLMTREPGGTAVGRGIRHLLLGRSIDGTAPVPRAEALLFAADRAQHVSSVVRPALGRGAIVVSDRYIDSSLAYQGARGELDPGDIASLSRWATHGLQPDLTIVLDIDPVAAAARLADRRTSTGSEDDRIEAEPMGYHQQVRQTFLDLAAANPYRYVVVDASGRTADVADRIRDAVRQIAPLSPLQRKILHGRLAADERARQAREHAAVAEARVWLVNLDTHPPQVPPWQSGADPGAVDASPGRASSGATAWDATSEATQVLDVLDRREIPFWDPAGREQR